MQLFSIPRASLFYRATRRNDAFWLPPFMALIGRILDRGAYAKRSEERIAAKYEGQRWCDSTERQLNNGLQSGNSPARTKCS
jgi:hypothetical protein